MRATPWAMRVLVFVTSTEKTPYWEFSGRSKFNEYQWLTRQALMVSTWVTSYCTLCALVCVFLCLVSSCSTLDFRQHSNADNWLIICFSSSSLSALLSCVLCRVLTTLLFAPLSHHSIPIRPGTNLRRRPISNRHSSRATSSCRLLLNAIIFLV